MLDLVVWERGAEPLGLGAVSRAATMPPGPAKHRRLASRDREPGVSPRTASSRLSFWFRFLPLTGFSLWTCSGLLGISGDLAAGSYGCPPRNLHGGSGASVADLRDPDELLRAEEGEAACTAVAEILARFPMARLRQEPQALVAVMSKGSPRSDGARRRRQDGLGVAHRRFRSPRLPSGREASENVAKFLGERE